jgi:hypothetical protein
MTDKSLRVGAHEGEQHCRDNKQPSPRLAQRNTGAGSRGQGTNAARIRIDLNDGVELAVEQDDGGATQSAALEGAVLQTRKTHNTHDVV